MSSDTVMTIWIPLTVRTTGRYPPLWGVTGPPSVPCHTGQHILLVVLTTNQSKLFHGQESFQEFLRDVDPANSSGQLVCFS